MAQVEQAAQTPVLSPQFQTSVPGLFMIGVIAANSFGPLLRFAYGAGFASRRLSHHLAHSRVQHADPATQARPERAQHMAAAE